MVGRETNKKLIEVALPLEEINRAAAREKSIRHGHPSTLHLWWARRPLAACRAVLFAQLVDDPSSHPDQFPTEEAQEQERKRLFAIIENLVKWENSNNEAVLAAARAEILKSCDDNPPSVLDPFCGGGSIPLEAQRLGLKAYGSDLNPVAVLITKALIEIPPKFAGKPPINRDARKKMIAGSYRGAQGLAEDVRYYGKWMRDEAERRIGHLYPKVKVTPEMAKGRDDLKGLVGKELTVIAWLWARTVKCPNPACGAMTPLVRSFMLSTKKGKEAWVEPVIDQGAKTVRFEVKTGRAKAPEGTVNRKGARCVVCSGAVPFDHIRAEAKAGGMTARLMAIVAEGNSARVYLSPTHDQELIASTAQPKDVPNTALPDQALGFRVQAYGMNRHRDLFTARQLVALTTFSDLVGETRERVLKDARASGMADDGKGIDEGGLGATAYADAVATYLAFGLSKASSRNCTGAIWETGMDRLAGALGRQAIPMTWDYAETNPLAGAGGNIFGTVQSVCEVLDAITCGTPGKVKQLDATSAINDVDLPVVATDPPYYDNIGYADLSDFFYVWLRRSVGKIYSQLFSTLLVPKAQELVATRHRFDGSKEKAQRFFEEGLGRAFARMREAQNPSFPLTLFYAFKQAETEENEYEDDPSGALVSTGWETMLEGLIRAGFQITGTWPMRTELVTSLKKSVSALASSVVLACRPRADDAPLATRREFVEALRNELPAALKNLQHGSIAPVDLAQAAIGPGMAVFSRYSKVLETDGSPMRVRTALGLINQALDEILAEQEGEYDAETRWALAWFEQYGTNEGKFGDAETLSRAKDTAVNALEEAGIVKAKAGKVQLVPRESVSADWDPASEKRLTVWELTQHLIRALETGGEASAARIIRRVGALAETAKDLAYRLYVICDRKGWPQEALAYNMLVKSWPELQKLASGVTEQMELVRQ
jgi:putative DNA methylase